MLQQVLNLLNIFHDNYSNIGHGYIHVTLCSRYLLNDKNYNRFFLPIRFYKLSLARLFNFCRFADFKLQKNKVQLLLNEEKIIQEVSLILHGMYLNRRKLLIGSFKRYCTKHGIWKRILRNKLDNLVAEAVEEARFRSRHNKVY